MEIVIGILGAGIGAGIMTILQMWLQRKWKKEDAEKIDPNLVKALVESQKVMMVDRIRYLGGHYIQTGEISLEEKETLHEMHKAYRALGGNGHLDTVMEEVDKLQVVERRYST